jgi:very-short-patch-repair endonuclease
VRTHDRTSRRDFRKELRNNLTPAEASLWGSLKGSRLGMKFKRQHGVGPYVVDFYCPEFSLAVELEGEVHADPARQDYDAARHAYLTGVGIRMLYFENRAVFEFREWVLQAILNAVAERKKERGTAGRDGS